MLLISSPLSGLFGVFLSFITLLSVGNSWALPISASAEVVGQQSGSKISGSLARDENFQKFRQLVQQQAAPIATLKSQRLAREGSRGFLVGAETLSLPQRELVQKENYYREQLFSIIAQHTKVPSDQVAAFFAERAR